MNIDIANRFIKLRKQNNLSQEELAEKLGISRQAVSKWERAESSPDTDNLIMLSRLYGVSLDELLDTKDEVIPQDTQKAEQERTETKHANPWILIPVPIICTVIFLLLGFMFHLWYIAWIIYLFIPIYYGTVEAFTKK